MGHNVKKRLCALLFFASVAFSPARPAPADSGADAPVGWGTVGGRVVDAEGQVLPGAVVRVESLQAGALSDVNGFYVLERLPAGRCVVAVSYVGYSPLEVEVEVEEGANKSLDLVLAGNAQIGEVEVKAAFHGQRRAVNMQKNGMGISNVVSSEQVGKFPDSNIGDALKRLPGINVQYDQGEARFGQVRGTGAELTSVTINGNRLPSAEGETRNVQLDLIPADMIQTVQVSKVVTADMDADAIGGAINLVTRQSPYKRMFNATAGTGYNFVSGKPQLTLGATWGDRFFQGRLGLMAAASFQLSPSGSDNTEFEYEDADGEVELKEAQVRQYYVTRQRQSYSLSADFEINDSHKLEFKGIYNRRDDWENRFRISYKKLNSKPGKQSVILQTKGGSADNRDARLERQQTMDFSLGGGHRLGALKADWLVSFARATEDRPEERYFGVALKEPFGDSFLEAGGRQPYTDKAIPSFDAEGWEIDELTNSNQEICEDEWKARLDLEVDMASGRFANALKFGGKFVSKSKSRDVCRLDYTKAFESLYADAWKGNLRREVRSGFMPGSRYPAHTPFVDNEYLGGLPFADMEGEEVLEDESGSYHASETVASGYVRLDQRLGERLKAVVGLRLERTGLTYGGLNWVVDADGAESLVPTGDVDNDYVNLLPSVLLKFQPTDALALRLSWTETLARPKYSSLIPCVNYSIADEEATIGNPWLKPTTATNLDLGAEYYFESVGMVGAGVFFKRMRDVVVDEVWTGESDKVPASLGGEYQITETRNAYDADLLGVEVALQRDFGFIAEPLKCLGLYANYTYTHSATRNHNFAHRSADDGKVAMTGSPEHSANASLFFERGGLSLRLSHNMASSFVDEMGETADLDRYYDRVNYLDFNASYTFGREGVKTTVYADATNLLNQPLRYYQGREARTAQVEYYGPRLMLGLKVTL